MPLLSTDRFAGSLLDSPGVGAHVANIVFDLDGTLVDSLSGIAASIREAIERVLPEAPMPDVRPLIGPPIATMFARLWPNLKPVLLNRLVAEFRRHYDDAGCLLSEPYPGADETLASLAETGCRLFVLTNKPSGPARRILQHLGLADRFEAILGPDTIRPAFSSKPQGAQWMVERFGLDAASTLMVGDGEDDAQSAEVCGFHFLAASYGYGFARLAEKRGGLSGIRRIGDLHFLFQSGAYTL